MNYVVNYVVNSTLDNSFTILKQKVESLISKKHNQFTQVCSLIMSIHFNKRHGKLYIEEK